MLERESLGAETTCLQLALAQRGCLLPILLALDLLQPHRLDRHPTERAEHHGQRDGEDGPDLPGAFHGISDFGFQILDWEAPGWLANM